jgi:hypothetical protein
MLETKRARTRLLRRLHSRVFRGMRLLVMALLQAVRLRVVPYLFLLYRHEVVDRVRPKVQMIRAGLTLGSVRSCNIDIFAVFSVTTL